jgi:hypothetical protein
VRFKPGQFPGPVGAVLEPAKPKPPAPTPADPGDLSPQRTFRDGQLADFARDFYRATLAKINATVDSNSVTVRKAHAGNIYNRGASTRADSLYALYLQTRDPAIVLQLADLLEGYVLYLRRPESKHYVAWDGLAANKSAMYLAAEKEPWWDEFDGQVGRFTYIRLIKTEGGDGTETASQGTDYITLDMTLLYATLVRCYALFDVCRSLSRGAGQVPLGVLADEFFGHLVNDFWPSWELRATTSQSSSFRNVGRWYEQLGVFDWRKAIAHAFGNQADMYQGMADWCEHRGHRDPRFKRAAETAGAWFMQGLAYADGRNGHEVVTWHHQTPEPRWRFSAQSERAAYAGGGHLTRYNNDLMASVLPLAMRDVPGWRRFAEAAANDITEVWWHHPGKLASKVNAGKNIFVDGSPIRYKHDGWRPGGSEQYYLEDTVQTVEGNLETGARANQGLKIMAGSLICALDPTEDKRNLKMMRDVGTRWGESPSQMLQSTRDVALPLCAAFALAALDGVDVRRL